MTRYLGSFHADSKRNFFRAVDQWQAELILKEVRHCNQQAYDSSSDSSDNSILNLATPVVQLLLSEPSLIDNPEIAEKIDSAVKYSAHIPLPAVTSLGLTPVLVRFLSSADPARRSWALAQLPAHARRPLSFDEWRSTGVGREIQHLYTGSGGAEVADRWQAVLQVITSGCLGTKAIEAGLIAGDIGEGRITQGLMATLSHLLGSELDCESSFVGRS